jgi:dTDP-4-dehydrorhamnose reductase
MRILVFGASGLLGNAVIKQLSKAMDINVYGTVRSESSKKYFSKEISQNLISNFNVDNPDSLLSIFDEIRPNIVVNCIGLVKQLDASEYPLQAIPINSVLPHRLALLSSIIGARLIHISTDCVFSGSRGLYKEIDVPDAIDLYGRSKLLGEVDYANAITLRTSIVGHELESSRSLIGWFLSQQGSVKGYGRAIFSGLPTSEIARIIRDYVIPNPELRGLYHVSAEPINKFDLLQLVAKEYDKKIDIELDDSLVIDRSLDSTRFRVATGYQPPSWVELIKEMRKFG